MARTANLVADLGIATNTLTDCLTTLVDAGVVVSLLAWGDRHLAPDDAPLRLRHTTCGHVATPSGQLFALRPGTARRRRAPLPGPGGRAAPGTLVVAELPASRQQA